MSEHYTWSALHELTCGCMLQNEHGRFNSTSMTETVRTGHTHNDEMCNLYLMFYSDEPLTLECNDNDYGQVGVSAYIPLNLTNLGMLALCVP